MLRTTLPPRYYTYRNAAGRLVLDDGSNFVAYLDNPADAIPVAWLHKTDADARHAEAVAALTAGRAANPDGYRHANCDHAYGICGG